MNRHAIIIMAMMAAFFSQPIRSQHRPNGELRTYLYESSRRFNVLYLYPQGTYSYRSANAKTRRYDTGYYRVGPFRGKLTFKSEFAGKHSKGLLHDKRYFLGQNNISEGSRRGNMVMRRVSNYAEANKARSGVNTGLMIETVAEVPSNINCLQIQEKNRTTYELQADTIWREQAQMLKASIAGEEEKQLKTLAEQLTKGISDDSLRFVKLLEWVLEHIEYDFTYASISDSMATIVRTGKAVCNGYARVLRALSYYVGIPCIYTVGDAFQKEHKYDIWLGAGHAWNHVKLHGTWYALDATFMDGNKQTKYYYQQWYLQDPRNMSETHFAIESALNFDPLRERSMRAHLNNPVISRDDQRIRYLGPDKNTLFPKDGWITLYFYSNRKDTMLFEQERFGMELPARMILAPGINRIRIAAPEKPVSFGFRAGNMQLDFLAAPGPTGASLWKHCAKEYNRSKHDSLFFSFLLHLNPKKELPLDPKLLPGEKNQAQWWNMLQDFNGHAYRTFRATSLSTFHNHTYTSRDTAYSIQVYFEDLKMNDKTPVWVCPLYHAVGWTNGNVGSYQYGTPYLTLEDR